MKTIGPIAWRDPRMLITGLLMMASASVHAAEDRSAACRAAKIFASGQRSVCLATEEAGATLGKVADLARCEARFDQAIARLDTAAARHDVPCRYTDNGDGTVRDLNTLLIWEQKTNEAGIHNAFNRYTWTVTGTAPDGPAFTEFLAQLNDNVSTHGDVVTGGFAGHRDWRLPTSAELLTLVVAEPFNCPMRQCFDPILGPPAEAGYWSSTSFEINTIFALSVDAGIGATLFGSKFNINLVRAVRGGR